MRTGTLTKQIVRFSQRTPCMDEPLLFDREIDDEAPAESNKRMKRAAQICKQACPELDTCAAFHQDRKEVAGVIAGKYTLRYAGRESMKANR